MRFFIFLFIAGISTVTESFSLSPGGTGKCKKEGRFPDPLDCGSYLECLDDGNGSLLASRRSCYGKAFNPRTLTCTDPAKVKGCHIRRGRQFRVSSRFSDICKDKTVNFACGDCGTQVTCSDGVAFETKCESNLRCTTNKSDFGGGVCHFEYEAKCSCLTPNTYRQDPYNNGTFFLCEDKDSIPMFYSCPPDMYFNETTKTCLNKDGTPACTERGIFAYPNDCQRYYMCTYAVEGWVQTKMRCPERELFNEHTELCEDPCEWSQKEFKCETEGRFKNPKDCTQFFECIKDHNGDFLKMMRACPPKYNWNDEDKRCTSQLESECKIKTEGPIKQCRKDYERICVTDSPPKPTDAETEITEDSEVPSNTEGQEEPSNSEDNSSPGNTEGDEESSNSEDNSSPGNTEGDEELSNSEDNSSPGNTEGNEEASNSEDISPPGNTEDNQETNTQEGNSPPEDTSDNTVSLEPSEPLNEGEVNQQPDDPVQPTSETESSVPVIVETATP